MHGKHLLLNGAQSCPAVGFLRSNEAGLVKVNGDIPQGSSAPVLTIPRPSPPRLLSFPTPFSSPNHLQKCLFVPSTSLNFYGIQAGHLKG